MESEWYSFTLIDKNGKMFDKVEDTFYLPHNSEFKIVFNNKSNKRADVDFIVDGTSVGEIRSNAHSTIKLERSVDKAKVFTFVSINSEEGKQGRLDLAPKLGTIEIHINPEKDIKTVHKIVSDGGFCVSDSAGSDTVDCGRGDTSAIGGTVLGKYSNQSFRPAEDIITTGKIVKLFANMKVKMNIESIHQ